MAVRGKVVLAWFCALTTFGYGLGDAAVASPGEIRLGVRKLRDAFVEVRGRAR